MNLKKKKFLSARVFGVGVGRISFNNERLADIKEALTKSDIKDLFADGAISIKEKKGRLSKLKRKTRRRKGSIRNRSINKKREYIILTRKFRKYLADLSKKGLIKKEIYLALRKEIRARMINDKAHLKNRVSQLVSGNQKRAKR